MSIQPTLHNDDNPGPRFGGVTSPNTTQVPDQYLDELLPILSGAELKVLLYVTRRTFGFKKTSDAISLSQMLGGIRTRDGRMLDHGVGLTKKTLLGAIKSLIAQNIILTERRRSAEKGDEPTVYSLHIAEASESRGAPPPLAEKFPRGGGGETSPRPRWKNSPTQHTVRQHTDFEYSKSESLEQDKTGEGNEPDRSRSQTDQTGSGKGMTAIGALMAKRPAKPVVGEDRLAIAATIERLAADLGDAANPKATATRAMNLFHASEMGRDAFLDLLFKASAEVKDRRRNPGKAPLPRNRMAYFFAVVGDRLGLRDVAAGDADHGDV